MNQATDWTSALAILAGGIVLGVLFVYFFSKRKAAGPSIDVERQDLEEKRDALITQLRDFEGDPAERARLESEAAAVLRELDARPASTINHQPSTAKPMSPQTKGFLWGFSSCAALAFLGWFVMQAAQPRAEGGSLTGNDDIGTSTAAPRPQAAQQQQPPDPMIQQMEAQVAANPNDLALRNDLAQAYLERDNLMAVFEQTKVVLAKSPNDSRALTYQALVRMAMGEMPAAIDMLQKATRSDARNLDAWVGLAWVYTQNDRLPEARSAIAQAVKASPGDKARLEQVFSQMQAQVALAKAQPSQPSAGDLPPDHPPIGGAPSAGGSPIAGGSAPAGAAATGRNVRVTLQIAPADAAKGGVIFLIARNPAGGPPYAVKRIDPRTLPTTVDFGAADSMMGQQLPDTFRLEARLDTDGDAASRSPTDPKAVQENVSPGATVTLALK